MKKESELRMSFPASNDRTLDIEEEEDEANDNKVNLSNTKKSEIPFLRRNHCGPNRIISREMSIDICDESSSSLLMVDTPNDDQVNLKSFSNQKNILLSYEKT
jgi:hypothetical protein